MLRIGAFVFLSYTHRPNKTTFSVISSLSVGAQKSTKIPLRYQVTAKLQVFLYLKYFSF